MVHKIDGDKCKRVIDKCIDKCKKQHDKETKKDYCKRQGRDGVS